MSIPKIELLAALRRVQQFVEAGSFGKTLIKATGSLLSADDGLEKWRETETNPFAKEILMDSRAASATSPQDDRIGQSSETVKPVPITSIV